VTGNLVDIAFKGVKTYYDKINADAASDDDWLNLYDRLLKKEDFDYSNKNEAYTAKMNVLETI